MISNPQIFARLRMGDMKLDGLARKSSPDMMFFLFSHEIEGMFRFQFSRKNQSIEIINFPFTIYGFPNFLRYFPVKTHGISRKKKKKKQFGDDSSFPMVFPMVFLRFSYGFSYGFPFKPHQDRRFRWDLGIPPRRQCLGRVEAGARGAGAELHAPGSCFIGR